MNMSFENVSGPLQPLLDSPGTGLCLVDIDGDIMDWSQGAERITGYSAGEAVGTDCTEILSYRTGEGEPVCGDGCPIMEAMESDAVLEWERPGTYLLDKNGEKVFLRITALPIHDDGQVVGGLEFFTEVSEHDEQIEALKDASHRDALTGLMDRGVLEEQLEALCSRSERYGASLSAIYLDIDHFKHFNDLYHHRAGDNVLKRLADTLRDHVRRADMCFRTGGEEFLILLPSTDIDAASGVAERIRRHFAAITFHPVDEKPAHVTLSAGVAEYSPPEDPRNFIERADSAMYAAKRAGRNRVRIWEETDSEEVQAGEGTASEATNREKHRDSKILIVDDNEGHRAYLAEVVRSLGYEAETAEDGFEAMARLKMDFDLLLVDAKMPGLDGFEVARRIREEKDAGLPIVMITALESKQDRDRAEKVGVNDYIAKPVEPDEVGDCIGALLQDKPQARQRQTGREDAQIALERRTAELEKSVTELTEAHRKAHQAQVEVIERLALAAEYRDEGTGEHIRRMSCYCALLGERLHLAPGDVEELRYGSLLHDVGKIGIPDAIMLKSGKLNEAERDTIRNHPLIGARILSGSSSKYLQAGETIALTHHEKWDGTGYPRGLEGEDIPLFGRICAVADAFDALSSGRPYQSAVPPHDAVDRLQEDRGSHFDPEILDLLVDNLDDVIAEGEDVEDFGARPFDGDGLE